MQRAHRIDGAKHDVFLIEGDELNAASDGREEVPVGLLTDTHATNSERRIDATECEWRLHCAADHQSVA